MLTGRERLLRWTISAQASCPTAVPCEFDLVEMSDSDESAYSGSDSEVRSCVHVNVPMMLPFLSSAKRY